jgi:hypothetical protein
MMFLIRMITHSKTKLDYVDVLKVFIARFPSLSLKGQICCLSCIRYLFGQKLLSFKDIHECLLLPYLFSNLKSLDPELYELTIEIFLDFFNSSQINIIGKSKICETLSLYFDRFLIILESQNEVFNIFKLFLTIVNKVPKSIILFNQFKVYEKLLVFFN